MGFTATTRRSDPGPPPPSPPEPSPLPRMPSVKAGSSTGTPTATMSATAPSRRPVPPMCSAAGCAVSPARSDSVRPHRLRRSRLSTSRRTSQPTALMAKSGHGTPSVSTAAGTRYSVSSGIPARPARRQVTADASTATATIATPATISKVVPGVDVTGGACAQTTLVPSRNRSDRAPHAAGPGSTPHTASARTVRKVTPSNATAVVMAVTTRRGRATCRARPPATATRTMTMTEPPSQTPAWIVGETTNEARNVASAAAQVSRHWTPTPTRLPFMTALRR